MSIDTAPRTNPANLPSYRRPEACAIDEDLQLVHDLLGGTRRMWDRSTVYIAKWTHEEPAVYDIRRRCETLFEGLGRTLNASVGLLFATPPTVTWNASESAMADQWANLDAAGTAGPVLVKRFADASLRDGLGAIVVDHPAPPIDPETGTPVVITAANEQALGLRPTWALYARQQIVNWRTAVVNNRKVLTLLVFAECGDVDDGAFGTRSVQRYRELRLVLTPMGYQAIWKLWELVDGEDGSELEHYRVVGQGVFRNRKGQIADTLPAAMAYTGRTDAPMTASIPLLGVAFANLAHWQQSTDLRFYRKLAAFPQPHVKGELLADPVTGQKGVLRFGPMVAIQTAADGDYELKELSGTSMQQLESGINEKLSQMAAMGLSFLQSDTRAAETAEAKRLDSVAQNATLATAAQGIEDAVNVALEIHAWYLGIEKAGAPVLTLSREYEKLTLDASMLTAYVALVQAGFPKRPVLEAMQAAGTIPQDADLDALEIEWESGLQAVADAKAQAAADRLLGMNGGQGDPNADPNAVPAVGAAA